MPNTLSQYFNNWLYENQPKKTQSVLTPVSATTPVTRTLPGGSTYQAKTVTPTPAVPATPVFKPASAQQTPVVAPAPAQKGNIPPQWINPKTGTLYSTDEIVANMSKVAPSGSIANYAGETMKNSGSETTADLIKTATTLNNQRNDLAVGDTDPYKIAGKSGIAYSPQEMAAIEKAYAGIYDPALQDVFTRLKTKEDQDAAALDLKNQIALKQTPTYADLHPTASSSGAGSNAQSAARPTYSIQAGEDPYNIAKNNGMTMAELKFINPQISDWHNINVNTKLNLPSDEDITTMGVADGSLPISQLRTLLAWSKDSGQKMKIYADAQRLNPNFNASDYELGMGMAKNVGVRKQIASMDNVLSMADELLTVSDQASRTGIPLANAAIINGGSALGIGNYADFKTAGTAFADELSGALGYGSATDMSKKMGFSMTDLTQSPEKFRQIYNNIIVPFINTKRGSLTNQMGVYGSNIDAMSSAGGGTAANNDPLGIR